MKKLLNIIRLLNYLTGKLKIVISVVLLFAILGGIVGMAVYENEVKQLQANRDMPYQTIEHYYRVVPRSTESVGLLDISLDLMQSIASLSKDQNFYRTIAKEVFPEKSNEEIVQVLYRVNDANEILSYNNVLVTISFAIGVDDTNYSYIKIISKSLNMDISQKMSEIYRNQFIESIEGAYPHIEISLVKEDRPEEYIPVIQGTKRVSVLKNAIVFTFLGGVGVLGVLLIAYMFNPLIQAEDDLQTIFGFPEYMISSGSPVNYQYIRSTLIKNLSDPRMPNVIGILSTGSVQAARFFVEGLAKAYRVNDQKAVVVDLTFNDSIVGDYPFEKMENLGTNSFAIGEYIDEKRAYLESKEFSNWVETLRKSNITILFVMQNAIEYDTYFKIHKRLQYMVLVEKIGQSKLDVIEGNLAIFENNKTKVERIVVV